MRVSDKGVVEHPVFPEFSVSHFHIFSCLFLKHLVHRLCRWFIFPCSIYPPLFYWPEISLKMAGWVFMLETAIFCHLPEKKKSLIMFDYQGFAWFFFCFQWSAWDSPKRITKLIFKTLYFLLQAYPMNYPTNLLRAFAVVCSWRILKAKISTFFKSTKLGVICICFHQKVNALRITIDNHRLIFSFIGKSTRFSTRLFLIVLPVI